MSSQNLPPSDQPQNTPAPEARKKEKKREKPSQSQASRAAKATAQQRTPPQRSQEKTEQRINKVLAAAGLGSRRQVDELIEQGRVEINGKAITQVGTKVDPNRDSITVDGELLKKHRPVYFALNKPEGVLCTNRDPQGRPRVIDFVPNQSRLFPVGRLDASSTGLILLTNDGELAQRLAHPKHGISKRYAVVVAGQVEVDDLKRLQRGIYIAEGKTKVDQAKLKKVRKASSELEITLSEGKNREIRRVLARLGHKVLSLQRIAIGPLKLADLPEGAYRPLSNQEVTGLYAAVDEIRKARKAERKARKKLLAESGISTPDEVDNDSGPSTFKPTKKKPTLQNAKLKKRPNQNFETDLIDDEDDDDDDNLDAQSILIRDSADPEAYDEAMDEFLMPPKKRFGSVIGQESFEDEDRVADATYTGFTNDDDEDEDDFDDEFEAFEDEDDFEETPQTRNKFSSNQKPQRNPKGRAEKTPNNKRGRPARNNAGTSQDSKPRNYSDRPQRRSTMRGNRSDSEGLNPTPETGRPYRSSAGRSSESRSSESRSSESRGSGRTRQGTGRKGFKSSPKKGTKKSAGRRGRTNNSPTARNNKSSSPKPKRGKR